MKHTITSSRTSPCASFLLCFYRSGLNEAKAFLISSHEMNEPLASPLVADQETGEAPSGRLVGEYRVGTCQKPWFTVGKLGLR